MSFGSFIREKRLEKGYTLRKFCETVDISPTFLSRMERDDIDPPGEEKLMAFAQALSIDSEELIFMAKRMPNKIKNMVIERPELVPLLRIANTKNEADLKHLTDMAVGRIENKWPLSELHRLSYLLKGFLNGVLIKENTDRTDDLNLKHLIKTKGEREEKIILMIRLMKKMSDDLNVILREVANRTDDLNLKHPTYIESALLKDPEMIFETQELSDQLEIMFKKRANRTDDLNLKHITDTTGGEAKNRNE